MSIDTCHDCSEQVDTDYEAEFYTIELADGQVINLDRGLCSSCREVLAEKFDKYFIIGKL